MGGCVIVALLIAIALFVYLVKSRRRHRIRQAALNRKRQSSSDAKNTNGLHNEFAALNKTWIALIDIILLKKYKNGVTECHYNIFVSKNMRLLKKGAK